MVLDIFLFIYNNQAEVYPQGLKVDNTPDIEEAACRTFISFLKAPVL